MVKQNNLISNGKPFYIVLSPSSLGIKRVNNVTAIHDKNRKLADDNNKFTRLKKVRLSNLVYFFLCYD